MLYSPLDDPASAVSQSLVELVDRRRTESREGASSSSGVHPMTASNPWNAEKERLAFNDHVDPSWTAAAISTDPASIPESDDLSPRDTFATPDDDARRMTDPVMPAWEAATPQQRDVLVGAQQPLEEELDVNQLPIVEPALVDQPQRTPQDFVDRTDGGHTREVGSPVSASDIERLTDDITATGSDVEQAIGLLGKEMADQLKRIRDEVQRVSTRIAANAF